MQNLTLKHKKNSLQIILLCVSFDKVENEKDLYCNISTDQFCCIFTV